jgi:hypothetical protein
MHIRAIFHERPIRILWRFTMSFRMHKHSMIPAILVGIAGLSIAPVAAAQDALGAGDALGSGNVLDANPQQGSGGSNPLSRDWNAEIAYRNAIVTGNVGGGREFRGNVGYSGIGDFRGALQRLALQLPARNLLLRPRCTPSSRHRSNRASAPKSPLGSARWPSRVVWWADHQPPGLRYNLSADYPARIL